MRIAITDANIFIDLIYLEMIDELFGIEVEIHTTANVIDELNTKQQHALQKFSKKAQLTIHPFEEFNVPERIINNRGLSESDKSVFGLAIHLGAFILTGDGVIRQISGFQKIEVHGILWLYDQFLEKKLITKKSCCATIESAHDLQSKVARTEVYQQQTILPDDQAVMKSVYIALREITKKWTMTVRNWPLIVNQFLTIFEGRCKI